MKFQALITMIETLGAKMGIEPKTAKVVAFVVVAIVMAAGTYFGTAEAGEREAVMRAMAIVNSATEKAEKRLGVQAPSWWRVEAFEMLYTSCNDSPDKAIQRGYERLASRFPDVPVWLMYSTVSAVGYPDTFVRERLGVACSDIARSRG